MFKFKVGGGFGMLYVLKESAVSEPGKKALEDIIGYVHSTLDSTFQIKGSDRVAAEMATSDLVKKGFFQDRPVDAIRDKSSSFAMLVKYGNGSKGLSYFSRGWSSFDVLNNLIPGVRK